MNNKPHKVCCYCEHGRYDSGDRSVGLSGYWECFNANIPDDVDYEDIGKENEDCPYFKSRLYDICSNCKREINAPQWLWEDRVYHGAYGDYPCCCEECMETLKRNEKEEIQKEEYLWKETKKFSINHPIYT